MNEQSKAFTGRGRRKDTRWTVKAADTVSHAIITVGGIGTIVAVSAVALILLIVVVPLFVPAKADTRDQFDNARAKACLHLGIDEYRTLGWAIFDDGSIDLFRLDRDDEAAARVIESKSLTDGERPTAWSFPIDGERVMAGFADGTVQVYRIRYRTQFIDEEDAPAELLDLKEGRVALFQNGIVQRIRSGQLRLQTLRISTETERVELFDGPVLRLDHLVDSGELKLVAYGQAGGQAVLRYAAADMEDEVESFDDTYDLPYEPHADQQPRFVKLVGTGGDAIVCWADGSGNRVNTSVPAKAQLVQRFDLVPDEGVELSRLAFLLGRSTLIVGESSGNVTGWFMAPIEQPATEARDATLGDDTRTLVRAKRMDRVGDAAITAIVSSTRSRMFVTGDAAGRVRAYYMTSENQLLEMPAEQTGAVQAVAFGPKQDAIVALTDTHLVDWDFEPMHPEATLASLFLPVWYEGYADPKHDWQSSAATDDYEPKYGLMPLAFGTIKATFYAMLIGAPLALLAAIFTSEFLPPKWKARIKPTIELMASLPSVVLGFLAALVFAPYLEKFIPATLAIFFAIPFTVMLAAYVWQLLPYRFTVIMRPHRFWFILLLTLPMGYLVASTLGPPLESLMFDGNIKRWLNGTNSDPGFGNPVGGWVLLLLPMAALLVGLVMTVYVNPLIRRRTPNLTRGGAALIDILKFLIGAAATVALAFLGGLALSGVGLDTRGPWTVWGFDMAMLNKHDQRNALVIGAVMGFAIIPIIYTIAEDALSTVPEHLRSGSLGAGATPWQTAVRIVVPTAMSGLFSAVMIGLGRAVGETMIVLMAFGNTPVLELNMFNGGRTLASNIAVELPEAPLGSTHYRVLFLAALVLFAMTFVLNTVAEAVRQHFRKKAVSL